MPYVKRERQVALATRVYGDLPRDKGELNYVVCADVVRYLRGRVDAGGRVGYAELSDAIDAVHDAECEMRRRLLEPHEDRKAAENGDVFAELLRRLGPAEGGPPRPPEASASALTAAGVMQAVLEALVRVARPRRAGGPDATVSGVTAPAPGPREAAPQAAAGPGRGGPPAPPNYDVPA